MAALQLTLAVGAGMLSLAIPGALVGLALRLRGLWLAASAPVISFAVIGLTAMAASFLGVTWSVGAVLVGALVTGAVGWGVARLTRTPRAAHVTRSGSRWVPIVAVGAGVLLMTLRTLRTLPAPDLFAQSFDNVFHLAAAKFIVDTGMASPWDISTLVKPGGGSVFYPSGWHALVALVAETSGVPVVVASNACLIVIACAVWPVGVVLLTRTIFGGHAPLLIAAGVVSAGFATYPFALIASMGTYPLVASIALVPVAIAGGVEATGLGSGYVSRRSAAFVLIVATPALAAVHPSALVMLAALTVPIAIVFAVRLTKRLPAQRRLIVLAVVLYGVVIATLMLVLRTKISQPDSLRMSVAQALGEAALSAFGGMQIAFVTAALTLVGIVAAARRRRAADWVALGLWATMTVIYVGTAGGDEFVRLVIGGPWYADASRIAAFTPIAIAPLAAIGASACWTRFITWVRHRGAGHRTLRVTVTAAAIAAFAAAMVFSSSVRGIDGFLRSVFTPTDNVLASLVGVGPDERELAQYIARHVPADDVLANNPRDASGFIYPLTGRHLLVPYTLSTLDDDRVVLYEGIADATPADPACAVARRLGVRWVVEFHPHQVLSGDHRFDGVKNIEDSPNVELVHRVGESSLYRITGCGYDAEEASL